MYPLDVWRVAKQLIKAYGYNDAIFIAALNADEILDKGDLSGYQVWKDILEIIEWIRDEKVRL